MRPSRGLLVLLGLLLCVTAGCVDLPTSGPVRDSPTVEQTDQQEPFDFTPGGPKPGATPVEIVNGYLSAMLATPLTTFVARQFLTAASGSRWRPEDGTVIYGKQAMTAAPRGIAVQLADVTELGGRGEWLGDPTGGSGVRYGLHLVREKGQWRISNPPNRLIIPQSHFDGRFQQYYLYFFDESAQVLVPEPVYVPGGPQAPTLLVAGLLRGPAENLEGVDRTFIPPGTALDDISVPVSRNGVAEVPLSEQMLDVRDEDLTMAFAELAWTLGQVPGIERFRVTVDGSPLDLPGSGSEVSVGAWSEFDPAVAWASQTLFGLRDGRAVTVTGDAEHRVPGAFGSRDYGLRSVGVDIPGARLAGVTSDGTKALASSRSVPPTGDTGTSTLMSGATDLLRPAWDLHGHVWLLDRTAEGAALWVVRQGVARRVTAPGITGADVRAFVLSRDGTRFVATIHRSGRDRLVIARVRRTPSGSVRELTSALPLSLGGLSVHEIRSLGWRTPASVAVLTGPNPGTSQVIVVKVDGSSALGNTAADPELFRDQAVSVVTSPSPGAPLYVGTTAGRLFELAGTGRWVGTGIRPGLLGATFVG